MPAFEGAGLQENMRSHREAVEAVRGKEMKKKAIVTIALAVVMSASVMAGCSGGAQGATSELDGQPAPMPASHNGRYMNLGSDGCYGCHGANEKANPQLVGAVIIPEDHYSQGMYATKLIDAGYNQCITCHPQG